MTNKFFYAALWNIPIFAVPAFMALFLGKYFDNRFETSKTVTIILLFLALVVSWIVVLRRNSRLSKEYKKVREGMKKDPNSNIN